MIPSLRWTATACCAVLAATAGAASVPYYWDEPHQMLFACNAQIQQYSDFCYDSDLVCAYNNWPCPCFDMDARGSLAGCLRNAGVFNNEYFEAFFDLCKTWNVTLNETHMLDALSYYNEYAKEYTPSDYPDQLRNITTPILLNGTDTLAYAESMCKFLDNFNISTYYGTGMLGYWVVILILGALANFAKLMMPGLMRHLNGKMSVWIRRYITLPAVHRKKTNNTQWAGIFQALLPSRYESIVVTIWVILVVVLVCVDVVPPHDDPLFPSRQIGTLRFVAGRCAVSCGMLVPLLILFGSRNNLLLWITHWSYSTFLTYHRWIGRVVFCLASVHAITFSYAMNSLGVGNYGEMMRRDYMVAGTVATVAAGFIVFQGFLVLRRTKYELFVALHILLALLFIGGSWGHVMRFNHHQPYVAATAVWAFDRVIRLWRLINFGCPKAQLTLIADETIRVTVPIRSGWTPKPGGFAFVYFIRPSCWWQSHPFTFNQSVVDGGKLVFYCKVKGGMTHGLYQHLKQCPDQTASVRVSVEGPYGGASPVKRYNNAIYVAGGNGVPGPYYEAYHLAKTRKDSKQTIRLFWVIREYQSVLWFYEELMALKNTKIECVVYVTRPNSIPFSREEYLRVRRPAKRLAGDVIPMEMSLSSQSSIGYSYDKHDQYEGKDLPDAVLAQIKLDLYFVKFIEGRPSMNELVQTTIDTTQGSVGFVTCGHPIMVDDLRQAVINHLDAGPRLDFFEHLQVWA
ncbi:hypothetical protein DIURU_003712 [Diutina rugosa]|uniref:ferric-chelate reductase (NADPH) n=1 Tax=Diutina rugosa TaxID=5481 RepID=A0A642UK70_DIURU|nr:uncharacterized protein DIURU_003712 [Diutina rugosa]KAA8900600.1 hypothetical protein DIURU_003712 [Diutina rugosa]